MEIPPALAAADPRANDERFATEQDSAAQFSSDFNSFLTLLTTQLQNQDPLEPMETSEFTNQLVQYSGVEQSIIGNGFLEELVDANTTNQQLDALNYLGKTVDLEGSSLSLTNGESSFQYLVDGEYDTINAAIIDENGKVVRKLDGEKTEGLNTLTWDGRDDDGNILKDGLYSVTVAATKKGVGEDGGEIPPVGLSTVVSGKVESITENEQGQPVLTINGIKRSIQQVIAVREGT